MEDEGEEWELTGDGEKNSLGTSEDAEMTLHAGL